MATQAKLYRGEKSQLIPPQTWTLLTFEKTIRNDRGMARDRCLIMPPFDGDFVWSRNLRWAALALPEGDERPQFMSRFVRDPRSERDDTGAADHQATRGRSWETVTWQFSGEAYEPVGVEVWHDHTDSWAVEHAQFVATTWDY